MPQETLSPISFALLTMVLGGSCYVYAIALRKRPLVPFVPRDERSWGGVIDLLKRSRTSQGPVTIPWAQIGEDIRLGVGAFLFGYPPVILTHALLQQFFPYNHDLLEALGKEKSWEIVVGLALSAVVFAPLWEEFLFRNLLQGGLEVLFRVKFSQPATIPIMISSALFAAAHFGQGAAHIPLFLFALLLGYLYYRTHRLLPCVIAHAMLNGFSVVQFLTL
jgi:membrane protease YdiL (CAAX protease family)